MDNIKTCSDIPFAGCFCVSAKLYKSLKQAVVAEASELRSQHSIACSRDTKPSIWKHFLLIKK